MSTDNAITVFARAGYAARGVVYLIIGGFATLAALGEGGDTTGSHGAMKKLLTAPFGDALLGAMAIGLFGYALWRCIQSIADTDNHGTDVKGLVIRASLLVSATTHLLLAAFTIDLIFTLGGGSGDSGGSKGIASWLMAQPFGLWLVGAVGLTMIGAGIAHGIKGAKTKFDRHFCMPHLTQHWAYPVCRFGLVVRGLVYVVLGTFFVIAAYTVNPDEAGGMAEVFAAFRKQPFGTPLMGFVAVGLFAFGAYSMLEAFYRRIDPP